MNGFIASAGLEVCSILEPTYLDSDLNLTILNMLNMILCDKWLKKEENLLENRGCGEPKKIIE
jgi:hypothetical protein